MAKITDRSTIIHEMAHCHGILRTPGIDTDLSIIDDGDHLNVVSTTPVPNHVLARAAIVAAFAGAFFRRFVAGETLHSIYAWLETANGSLAATGVLNDPAVSDYDREMIAALPDADDCGAEIDLALELASRFAASPEALDSIATLIERNGQVGIGFRAADIHKGHAVLQ